MNKNNTTSLQNFLEANAKNLRKILANTKINIIFNNYNDNSQHFYDNNKIKNKIGNFYNNYFNSSNNNDYEEFKQEIMNNCHFNK